MKSIKTNAVLNIIQNICKVVFPLVTLPYASRVLQATNYGRVSFGNSIVRYFILLSALGIATYAQREAPAFRDDKRKFTSFANEVFSINVYATIFSYVVLIVLLMISYKLKDYTMLILIQSTAILLTTLGADWVNVIYEDYFFITIRYLLMQCIALVALFLFVKTPSDYYIYALINVIATAGGNLLNIFYIRRYVHFRLVYPRMCIQHMKPILLLFCVSITTVIYVSSDITILGYFMTDADVGVYTMAANIYSVVKQVISAVIVVSIPRMAYYLGNNRSQEYVELAKKVLNTLISLLLPAIVGLAFLSHDVLNVMGGSEYLDGQSTLILLAIALLFAIMAGFYANGYLLLVKKDNVYLFATTFSALINIALNFVLIPKVGIVGAAITTILAEVSMTVIAMRHALSEYRLLADAKVILSSGVSAVAVAFMCYMIRWLSLGSIVNIIVSFFASLLAYYVLMKLMRNPIAEIIDSAFAKVVGRVIRRS